MTDYLVDTCHDHLESRTTRPNEFIVVVQTYGSDYMDAAYRRCQDLVYHPPGGSNHSGVARVRNGHEDPGARYFRWEQFTESQTSVYEVVPPTCTGDMEDGSIYHNGDTCPIHETRSLGLDLDALSPNVFNTPPPTNREDTNMWTPLALPAVAGIEPYQVNGTDNRWVYPLSEDQRHGPRIHIIWYPGEGQESKVELINGDGSGLISDKPFERVNVRTFDDKAIGTLMDLVETATWEARDKGWT